MSLAKPVTSDEFKASIREAIALYDDMAAELPPELQVQKPTTSADSLRNIFPDLDDLTLAGFTAYITINTMVAFAIGGRGEPEMSLFVFAMHYGQVTKQLAWSLDTPEAPEPKTKGA